MIPVNQFILPAPDKAPAASNRGAAGSGTPICSRNTAANRTNVPCRTRNSSVSVILVPGSAEKYSRGSGDDNYEYHDIHSLHLIWPPTRNLKIRPGAL